MSNQEKPKPTFDRILSVLALVAGIVALFFSWQANRIAQDANYIASRQVTSQVVVLSGDHNGAGFSKQQQKDQYIVRCQQVIRLSNLGGASTAIVGYEVAFYYKGTELRATSDQSTLFITKPLTQTMQNFQVVFVNRDFISGFDRIVTTDYLPFPLQVNSFTTMDIHSVVDFILEGSYRADEIEMPSYPYQFKNPKSFYNLLPLEVAYSFITASKEKSTSPKMLCLYVK